MVYKYYTVYIQAEIHIIQDILYNIHTFLHYTKPGVWNIKGL